MDATLATDATAREATRSFVEADVAAVDRSADAEARAVDTGLEALVAFGRDPERATVALSELAGGYTRCARATFTATYEVPALTLPWIGGSAPGSP